MTYSSLFGFRKGSDTLQPDSVGFGRNLFQAIAVQGPVAGSAIVPGTMAAIVGRAAPLSFLVGIVAGLLVVVVFMKLARRIASSGSLYHFSVALMGIRAAFVVGWIYFLTYFLFTGQTISQTTSYLDAGLRSGTGHAIFSGAWWAVPALLIWAGLIFFVSRNIRISTSFLMVVESVGLIFILVTGIIVLAKGGYAGHSFGFSYFTPHGQSLGSIALGVSTAFLGFGGFESGAFLGEETSNARRVIPAGMLVAVLFSGLFYTFSTWVIEVGFSSPSAMASSPAPLFDVVGKFTSTGVGTALAFVTCVASFSTLAACANGSLRVTYAIGRDVSPQSRLVRVHGRQKSPTGALMFLAIPYLAVSVAFIWTDPTTAFDYVGTASGLLLTVVYFVVATTAIWFFLRQKDWFGTACAVAGGGILGYALYSSVYPAAPFPYNLCAYAVAAFIAGGVVVVVFSSKLTAALRRSEQLVRLTGTGAAGTAAVVAEAADSEL